MKFLKIILLTLCSAIFLAGCDKSSSHSSVKSNGYSSYSSGSSGSSSYSNSTNSSSSNSSGTRTSISQLSIGEPTIKTGKINDTIYVKVTNNSSNTLTGSIKAYIYYQNQIQDSAILYLPNDGLSPGDTSTIDGIFNTINGQWDEVEFEASTLRVK